MKKWAFLALFIILSSTIHAEEIRSGSITLLALLENGEGKSGTVASLHLELRPGKERVFLETFLKIRPLVYCGIVHKMKCGIGNCLA